MEVYMNNIYILKSQKYKNILLLVIGLWYYLGRRPAFGTWYLGSWSDKYNQRSPCEVSGVIVDSMRNPPPWNIKMDRRVCCATNFYPVGQESVRVWDASIIEVKQHKCAWFSGWVTAWAPSLGICMVGFSINRTHVHVQRALDFNTYQVWGEFLAVV